MGLSLHVSGLTKRYGHLTALSEVSFSIRPGEVLGLIGPNGSGKTTLFELKAWLDGELALEYTLGSQPGPGRGGGPPNPDLIPANNPVLQPPVAGKVGLWAKTDSTSYFKDYVVSPK